MIASWVCYARLCGLNVDLEPINCVSVGLLLCSVDFHGQIKQNIFQCSYLLWMGKRRVVGGASVVICRMR